MAVTHQGLGELELEVLKTIWQQQPCTVQEVADLLNDSRGCARTTVLTVMQRLHAKGYLRRRKKDGVFRYSTTQGRKTVMSGLVGQFVDKVLDGSPLPFVAYLAEMKDLTPKQADRLHAILNELESRGRRSKT